MLLFKLAVVLSVLSAASLLFKPESIRGFGRVLGGVSLLLLGAFLVFSSYSGVTLTAAHGHWSVALVASGFLTFGSGLRKYMRRNLPAQAQ